MLRVILSPTRSGSGALLRCFENNPAVSRVFHQPVKSGYRQDGRFDYSLFSKPLAETHQIYVAKETIGGFEEPEATFPPLPEDRPRHPSEEWVRSTLPLFLFRDPAQTWNSIDRLNEWSRGRSPYFSPFEYFRSSYRRLFSLLVDMKRMEMPVACITLEHLGADPEGCLRQVCTWWSLPYIPSMVAWELPYGAKTWFSEETLHRMGSDLRFMRLKERLASATRFSYAGSPFETHLSPEQEQDLHVLMELYREASELAADFLARP